MAFKIYGNFGVLLATAETEDEANELATGYTTRVAIVEV